MLRTIETKELRPLGGSKYRHLDVRFIAATSRDARAMVETGEFRRDLYYRLSIFVYTIPPLRQRMQDFPALASFLAGERDSAVSFSPSTLELFMCYSWPGNVREVRNVIHYALAKSNGEDIGLQHLPEQLLSHCRRPDILRGQGLRQKTECFEAQILEQVLRRSGDPQTAADQLGLGLRTLYRKLKRYRIPPTRS